MTTWNCRGTLLAGALLGLSACDDMPLIGDAVAPAIGFLEQLKVGGAKDALALSQTEMAEGAFTLVPPQGFCIDRNTLRQHFALMARCDTLGAPRLAGGAPLGLITVSVTALEDGANLPGPLEVVEAAQLTHFDSEKSENNAVTFRAEGPAPGADLDRVHWRGLVQINTQLLGIAFYGPEGGRVVTPEGRDVINSLIRKTQAAS